MNLFHYDFRPIEETLGIDCFSTILDYKAIGKTERMYNKNVSEKYVPFLMNWQRQKM